MNANYFLESVDKYLTEHNLWTCTRSADCLEAIAKCIRIIASTAPALGTIIFTGIKLCRGEASLAIARILEKFATDIRLEASRMGHRNQSLDSESVQKSVCS